MRLFFFLLKGGFPLLSRPIGGGIFLYDGDRKNKREGGGRMARWVYFNPNPEGKRVGDCAVRALCKALDRDWEQVYTGLCLEGFALGDMPSADRAWGAYLRRHGFRRHALPETCPDCYTVADFAQEHPQGLYILALNSHVVCLLDGCWHDTWDSGDKTPLYYWTKEED